MEDNTALQQLQQCCKKGMMITCNQMQLWQQFKTNQIAIIAKSWKEVVNSAEISELIFHVFFFVRKCSIVLYPFEDYSVETFFVKKRFMVSRRNGLLQKNIL